MKHWRMRNNFSSLPLLIFFFLVHTLDESQPCNSWHPLYLTEKKEKEKEGERLFLLKSKEVFLIFLPTVLLVHLSSLFSFLSHSSLAFHPLWSHAAGWSWLHTGQQERERERGGHRALCKREKNKGQLGQSSWVQSVIIFVISLILMSCHLTHAKAGPQASTDRSIGYNVHFFFLSSPCPLHVQNNLQMAQVATRKWVQRTHSAKNYAGQNWTQSSQCNLLHHIKSELTVEWESERGRE